MSEELYRSILAGDDDAYYRAILAQAMKLTSGRLRHPESRSWTDSDPVELANDYWISSAMTAVLLAATDDDSLNALIYTALRNQVINRSRASDRGRLLRRLKEILREEGYAESPRSFWRRQTDSPNAYGGSRAKLLEAAARVEGAVIRWSPNAKRNSPVADRKTFIAVLDAVFETADGAIDEGELVAVLAHRFGVAETSMLEVVDEHDEFADSNDPSPEDAVIATEDYLAAVVDAVEIFGQLSPDEQRMLPFASVSARDAADALGMGKTKANGVQQRLKYKLGVLLANFSDGQQLEVLEELQSLAQ